MTDKFSNMKRSQIMAKITSKNTKPELLIRKALHNLGYRYILHDKRLPGNPDMVFPKFRAIIEVNGCFWHGHNCHIFRPPKSNIDYWQKKIENNKKRDMKNIQKMKEEDWRILVIWECSIKGKTKLKFDAVINSIENWLYSDVKFKEITGMN